MVTSYSQHRNSKYLYTNGENTLNEIVRLLNKSSHIESFEMIGEEYLIAVIPPEFHNSGGILSFPQACSWPQYKTGCNFRSLLLISALATILHSQFLLNT